MCGIFGFILNDGLYTSPHAYVDLLERLCLLSETRGKDASGLVVAERSTIHVLKRPLRARKLLKSHEYAAFRSHLQDAADANIPFLVMGHTRMVTNGKAESHDNNQPVIRGERVCIHNGIVVNDGHLWEQYSKLRRRYEVDTEIILALLELLRSKGQNLPEALCNVYQQIVGANSVALIEAESNLLALATANGSLFWAMTDDQKAIIFASEKCILSRALQHTSIKLRFHGIKISQVQPGTAVLVDYGRSNINAYLLDLTTGPTKSHPGSLSSGRVRDIDDMRPNSDPVAPVRECTDFSFLERLCEIDQDPIRALRRCTRCILPETFPFITFDSEGVCNYCRNYRPWHGSGKDGLEQIVAPFRKRTGEAECLAPISGGRDSSYALHYLCKELGLKPVAYTYDWGMVTDLARRNISRMCGALGVEHILISADIAQKRANIRMNVLAWLKKPHLGTVTLFMAGDKHFFYYARMLRKQMGLGVTLFGMNPFERTDFKVAFCYINENYAKEVHYNLQLGNKLRMMLFFARRFAENPHYLNRTVLDTFMGFFSYYLIPKDYYSIYDYIYWDEEKINGILLGEYDWETSPDTKTTWRIGDGTASFYNYIYYRAAGFSENDTLRSNQIREGKMDRARALEIAFADNQARVESIKWYCDTIGIDCVEAIKRINAMPRLY